MEFASSTGNQSICSWNAKSSRELFSFRNEIKAIIAKKTYAPRLSCDVFERKVCVLQLQIAPRIFSGIHLQTPFLRISCAPRGSQSEKGRSPPHPLKPLGSGGTDSALRLVTCWSSDALRLSSSGRTGRKSPLKAAARYAPPSSSCSISSSSSQTLSATLARNSKKSGYPASPV